MDRAHIDIRNAGAVFKPVSLKGPYAVQVCIAAFTIEDIP